MSPLAALPLSARCALLTAFEGGRLDVPYTAVAVARYVGVLVSDEIASELQRLGDAGMTPAHLCELLRVIARDVRPPHVSLVWSGPEVQGSASRETSVVVRELFSEARSSVLVAGFAVHQGRSVFRVLADRMDADESLRARMFLNIERKRGDTTTESGLLRIFGERFRGREWPGRRLPEVYYDPRALAPWVSNGKRCALHAKCVVVDEEKAFVTSANFTEAAQERNIEAGALTADTSFAAALVAQFEALVRAQVLQRLPL